MDVGEQGLAGERPRLGVQGAGHRALTLSQVSSRPPADTRSTRGEPSFKLSQHQTGLALKEPMWEPPAHRHPACWLGPLPRAQESPDSLVPRPLQGLA